MSAFYIKRNDTSPSIKYTLDPVIDATGASVLFSMQDRNGVSIRDDAAAVLVQANPAIVQYDWTASDTANAGSFIAEFTLILANGKRASYPNASYIAITIDKDL